MLIDGYNLIRQSPDLAQRDALDIEEGRKALIARLAEYRRIRGRTIKITVVFDGWGSPHMSTQRVTERGVTVFFTRQGETADAWMKRRVHEMGEGVVVTSDRDVRDYACRAGIATITSDEFERRMEEATYTDMKGFDEDDEPSLRPPKKGVSRRPGKRERKRKSIVGRL